MSIRRGGSDGNRGVDADKTEGEAVVDGVDAKVADAGTANGQ